MIGVSFSPNRIAAGRASEVFLEIFNQSSGDINHLIADLDIPVTLLLIKGSRRISIPRLPTNGVSQHTFVIRGRQVGPAVIGLRGLSCRGSDGKTCAFDDIQLPLEVYRDDQSEVTDVISLQLSLSQHEMVVGQWGRVTGVVSNVGGRTAENLRITLEEPWQCEPFHLPRLQSGGSIEFSLPVFASEAGEQVPAVFKIISPSGASIFSWKAFLCVLSNRPKSGPEGMVIQGSKVEITYGDRSETQVSTGGDAVITGSNIGAAATDSGPPKCTGCGQEVGEQAKFCENCGTRL